MRDGLDRLRWHLRLGTPGPVESAAVAIAARELAEADVDLATWRRARAQAGDDERARPLYVRLRVAALRRELRDGAAPRLAADLADRQSRQADVLRRAEAWRATPEGERAYHAALDAALAGLASFTALYVGAVLLVLLVVWWLASG